MASVTSASRYGTSASRFQCRSSMYIRGLIQRNSTELAQAVPIDGPRHNETCHWGFQPSKAYTSLLRYKDKQEY